MQIHHETTTHQATDFPSYRPSGGGRISSDRYRQAIQLGEAFEGLEAGFTRYDLLLLVKRVGRDAGFTPRMIQLLEYYLTTFTRDIDWEEGRPIVYQSLAKTALDLGVNERQVQKLEKQLFDIGAIGYVDSGNCKRYGQRDPRTGVLLWAFGVDLSPLAHLREELADRLHQKQLYNQAWSQAKREISSQRRRIRSLMLEWRDDADRSEIERFERAYEKIAFQLRTHVRLETLRGLLQSHKALHDELLAAMGVEVRKQPTQSEATSVQSETSKRSSTSVETNAHYKYTNQLKNICRQDAEGFQESVAEGSVLNEPTPSSGAEHVTLRQVASIVSERFRGFLPIDMGSMGWSEVVEAADRLRRELGVSQASWGEACSVLGRSGASICLLITDRASLREEGPVRQPAAYFRGMVNRARRGELRLHSSVFGLLAQRGRRSLEK